MRPPPSRSARAILLFLVGACLVVIAMIMRPFASALFMGAVLAVSFHPWYTKLCARLRGRRKLSAALITIGLVLALVLPVTSLTVAAIRQTVTTLDQVHEVLGTEGVDGLIRRLPEPLQSRVQTTWNQLPRRDRNVQFIYNLERRAAALIPRLVNAVGSIAVQSALMVVALFFLLMDGSRLVGWLNTAVPLQKTQIHELFAEFRRVSSIVLVGSVVTAAVQSAAALVGYLFARVPNPHFFTLLTFFIGLVPIVGAGGVSFGVAVYMWLTGHPYAAIFLAVWSVLVVGLLDNVVKPLVIKGGIEMHGAIVFFSLLGGFAVFGLVGLVLGPLSVTLLLAVMRIYQRDYSAPEKPAV